MDRQRFNYVLRQTMAHFAKLDENNVVLEVHVINNNEMLQDGVEVEHKGVQFLVNWSGGYLLWKQTSYNGSFRKNYAGVGYVYDNQLDAFIPPKPFESWTLNIDTCLWNPPSPIPTDGQLYNWDESTLSWVVLNG
jgi:hypothetical protein